MTGSYRYYIDMMVAKARQDDAPADAIYYDDRSREWRTVDYIASLETKARVKAFASRLLAG